MSTRSSIAYSEEFHLFQECFENDNVYLRLDSGNWDASMSTADIDWRDGNSSRPSLLLKVDVKLWRKIVEGWIASEWGKDPSIDNTKFDIDIEAIEAFAKRMKVGRSPPEVPDGEE